MLGELDVEKAKIGSCRCSSMTAALEAVHQYDFDVSIYEPLYQSKYLDMMMLCLWTQASMTKKVPRKARYRGDVSKE